MSNEARFECRARMACLDAAVEFIDAFCATHAIERPHALRLRLMVEELFTNTVVHGHGGDCDAPLRLHLQLDAARVSLGYSDSAPAFDPLAGQAEGAAALDAELADRPVGHLGVVLITHLAARATYEYRDGWNCVQLELDRTA